MGALTMAGATTLTPAAPGTLIDGSKTGANGGSCRTAKFYRIIGVGGAGCNLLAAMWAEGVFEGYGPRTKLIAVDTCPDSLSYVKATNEAMPERAPINTIAIAEFGSGGNVDSARDAALKHGESLKAAVTGADVVILVAGLGRGTGSGVTPILAKMAHTSGALTVVIAVTAFDFEGAHIQTSDVVINKLRRDADLVLRFSNQALGDELGDGATYDYLFEIQQQRIAASLTSICMPLGHTSLGPGNGLTP